MSTKIEKICSVCNKKFIVTEKDLKHSPYLFSGSSLDSEYICDDDYEKRWDKGFSSSVEYSDEMMLREKQEIFEQEKISKEYIDSLKFVLSYYGVGMWRCIACNKVRLESKPSMRNTKNVPKFVGLLSTKCTQCGITGSLNYKPD